MNRQGLVAGLTTASTIWVQAAIGAVVANVFSIALALSLTAEMHRELFLVITYIIVVFSIIGQGLTVETIIKRLSKGAD